MDDAKKKAGPPNSLSRKETKANKRNTNKKRRQAERKSLSENDLIETIKSISFKGFLSLTEAVAGIEELRALITQVVKIVQANPKLGRSVNQPPRNNQVKQPEQTQLPADTATNTSYNLNALPEGVLGSIANATLDAAQRMHASTKYGGQGQRVAGALEAGLQKIAAGFTNKQQQQQHSQISQADQIGAKARDLIKRLGPAGMKEFNAWMQVLYKSDPDTATRTRNFITGG